MAGIMQIIYHHSLVLLSGPLERRGETRRHGRLSQSKLHFKKSGPAFIAFLLFFFFAMKESHAEAVGTYFRMQVHLTYKGQPVDIDFVGGCRTRYINYAYGGTTVEPVSMSAFVFGARMPEGHAVVIRTVPYEQRAFKSPCSGGTTANGEVPNDWLPFIVWYERDDEFTHGVGYATQDAYENPNAKFGFRSVTVEHATKQEYEAFMKTGQHNLLPSYLTDWLTHLDAPDFKSAADVSPQYLENPVSAWTFAASPICRSARKIRLTPEQRDKIRQMWPTDHPLYWAPETRLAQSEAESEILTEEQLVREVATYSINYSEEDRLETRKVYPIDTETALVHLTPKTGESGFYFNNILVDERNDNLGFMYCDSPSPWKLEERITGRVPAPVEFHSPFKCRIGNYILPIRGDACDQGHWIVFERDEFAIVSETNIVD